MATMNAVTSKAEHKVVAAIGVGYGAQGIVAQGEGVDAPA